MGVQGQVQIMNMLESNNLDSLCILTWGLTCVYNEAQLKEHGDVKVLLETMSF